MNKGSESESNIDTTHSARKGWKQKKHFNDLDIKGNDSVHKVYTTRRSLQTSSTIKKESSPDGMSEDSGVPANSSDAKPETKKLLVNKQELDEGIFNNSGSKSDGSKSKKDKEMSSDSASDTQCASPPKKNRGPKKHPRGRGASKQASNAIEPQEEVELKCPVPHCDSIGHLSGNFAAHSNKATCPLYHNTIASECVARSKFREQRSKEREHSTELSAMNKFGLRKVGPSAEQKEQYQQELLQRKKTYKESSIQKQNVAYSESKESKDAEDKSREPLLTSLAPLQDVEWFKEGQARAAEALEERLLQHKNEHGIVRILQMGRFEMDVWYKAPYPEEYQLVPRLYICEYCLKYMNSPTVLRRHIAKCIWRFPPGDEIYRKRNISFFEVDGQKCKTYCQNLCLLAKLFLDHKTLYFDVEPFLFYVMTETDGEGMHIVGYFSKEKNSFLGYNVSCILTLPPYQRQGYGRMLIDFSYLLSKVEGKIGSPEKPLSDLGLISYRSYWRSILLEYISSHEGKGISIRDISQETSISPQDIVSTFQAMGFLKYWKGKHIVMKNPPIVDDHMAKVKKRKTEKIVDKKFLSWSPPTQNNNTNEH